MRVLNKDCCILIMSCDKYHDTRNPFFHFFRKFRADCPYPIFLAKNKKEYINSDITTIDIVESNRSEEMALTLEKLNYKYVLYLQDDYFFTHQVEENQISKLFSLAEEHDLWYLRVYPEPLEREALSTNIDWIEKIVQWTPFITALQASIRNIDVFKKLLKKWETIREFEINSPKRTLEIENEFWSLTSKSKWFNIQYPIEYFCTAIRRWKWRKKALDMCEKEGLIINMDYRGCENYFDLLKKDLIYNRSPLWLKKILTNILW